MDKKWSKTYIVAIIVFVVTSGIFYMIQRRTEPSALPSGNLPLKSNQTSANFTDQANTSPTPSEPIIKVHVIGAVQNPGVYSLPLDSRAEDAVAAAGGFTDDANEEGLNLAAPLRDGQQLAVPSNDGANSTLGAISADGLVNINTATLSELMTLPNVGEVRAKNIIKYREANNGFRSVEELGQITGIGEKLFEGMKEYVTVY